MKTPAEIKKAFVCCMQMQGCRGCPYSGFKCVTELSRDTLEYIQHLEAKLARYSENDKKEEPDGTEAGEMPEAPDVDP